MKLQQFPKEKARKKYKLSIFKNQYNGHGLIYLFILYIGHSYNIYNII